MFISGQGFWDDVGVSATGPLAVAIVGSGIIGGIAQRVAMHAEEQRQQFELLYRLTDEMVESASALYVQTQRYWRASKSGNPRGRDLLPDLRTDLDAQYDRSRTDGLVLESQLRMSVNRQVP